MESKLTALEEERKKVLEEQKKGNLRSIPLFIIGAVLLISTIAFDLTPILLILGIVALVAGIIITSVAQRHIIPFKKKFKKEVILRLLQENYQNVSYDPHASIPLNTLLSLDLLKRPDRHSSGDLITGTHNNIKFEVSEFTLEDRQVRRDSRGNTHVTYEKYFKGRFFIFEFDKKFDKELRIIEKIFLNFGNGSNGLAKVETESISFNKKFNVYATDQHHAFYIITSKILEEIERVEKIFGGTISLVFKENKLYVVVNDNKDTLEPNIKVALTGESLNYYLYDILVMSEMIFAFNLTSTKFTDSK